MHPPPAAAAQRPNRAMLLLLLLVVVLLVVVQRRLLLPGTPGRPLRRPQPSAADPTSCCTRRKATRPTPLPQHCSPPSAAPHPVMPPIAWNEPPTRRPLE